MSVPPLNPPDPAAMDSAGRRAHIAMRTARLRTLGTAGAISTLGVFIGLAAAHSPASPKPAAIAPPAADTVVPATSQLSTPSDNGFVSDDHGGSASESNRTVNPAPAPQYDVAPPRPAAPPATMSSTS